LPEVIQAAKTLPEKAFVEKMNKDHSQHLETRQPVVMASTPDMEERKAAIEMAMVCEECSTESEAEKAIYVSYIQDHAAIYEHKREGVA